MTAGVARGAADDEKSGQRFQVEKAAKTCAKVGAKVKAGLMKKVVK